MVCEKKCDFNVRGFIVCQINIKGVKYNKKGSYFRNGLTKKDILKKIIYFYDIYIYAFFLIQISEVRLQHITSGLQYKFRTRPTNMTVYCVIKTLDLLNIPYRIT